MILGNLIIFKLKRIWYAVAVREGGLNVADELDEAIETFRVMRKAVPFTDKDHIVWAREAVRCDVRTALARIKEPLEKIRLFDVLRQLLDKMEARYDEPVSDGLKRLPR